MLILPRLLCYTYSPGPLRTAYLLFPPFYVPNDHLHRPVRPQEDRVCNVGSSQGEMCVAVAINTICILGPARAGRNKLHCRLTSTGSGVQDLRRGCPRPVERPRPQDQRQRGELRRPRILAHLPRSRFHRSRRPLQGDVLLGHLLDHPRPHQLRDDRDRQG